MIKEKSAAGTKIERVQASNGNRRMEDRYEMAQVWAHRGVHMHQENTLEAFASCSRAGADSVELDVQLTKDVRWLLSDERIDQVSDETDLSRLYTCGIKDLNHFNKTHPGISGCKNSVKRFAKYEALRKANRNDDQCRAENRCFLV